MKKITRKAAIIVAMLLSTSIPYSELAHAISTDNAVVLATSLNVRIEPAQQSRIVGSLSYGTIVSVTGESYGWAKISSGKMSGWVAGHYLKQTDNSTTISKAVSPSSKQGGTSGKSIGTVQADALRMRKGPGLDQGIVRVLPMNMSVEIIGQQSDWLQIRTSSGETGWVSGSYIGKQQKTGSISSPSQATSSKYAGKPGLKGKIIVIDAGHGGSDVGAIGTKFGTLEKTVNLQTASKLAANLRQKGAVVVMTRTGADQNPALHDRVEISEAKGADAFISIHYNSSPKNVNGTLTFFYSDQKDKPLAHAIEARLGQVYGTKSNGISFGDYHVLRENDQPSVLLELGFLTDAKDEALVRTADYQQRSTDAIVKGLADYFGD
ncbi:N-acetylmuramoyl-L-alanine amidase [Brevibacillus choshinensis]|uniref:N-acetylmuramoyl-L-alanine amidase n=1 Tax=Brevibacillus choshinensis TaxID=54911 RepID=UPI002E20C199|nr:N-acetylmuramoyl-L-alanine amidase [Brevibacillus choshinensis]MED4751969.1 N-acetylmuramoyl-L-alanine amidase [Brevibacillus choshinensis]